MEQQVYITGAIVREAQQGSRKAFEQLYKDYSKAMYNICYRMMGNEDDANDMLQEGFIQAFTKISSLAEPERFGGWLKTIVIRLCIKGTKHKYNTTELDENEDWMDEKKSDFWSGMSIAKIEAAIRALPDGCRQVFNLFAVENLSHADIAGTLNITEGTSKSQYHRARQLLRLSLSKELNN